MPSQLPPNVPIESLELGSEAIANNPEFGALAMELITLCAEIEAHYGRMLATALEADAATVIAMYLAVRADSARACMLETALRRLLTQDDLKLFLVIRKISNESAKTRQKFAHHIWGTSQKLKDAVVLVDPRSFVQNASVMHGAIREVINKPTKETIATLTGAWNRLQARVYKKHDFERAVKAAREAAQYVSTFQFMLFYDSLGSPKEATGKRNWLLQQPAIQHNIQAPSGTTNP